MAWLLFPLLFAAPLNAGTPKFAVVFEMGERHGEVEPCGCPRVQLGGLNRLVNLVDSRMKAAHRLSVPVIADAGNSFFSLPVLPPTRLESEKRKADLIADAYKLLGVQVLVPGPKDLALGPAELDRLAQRAGLKLLPPGSHAVIERNGMKIGWMGIGEAPPPETLRAALRAFGTTDVNIAVTQTPDGGDAARAAGFDLVISAPQPEGKSVSWGTWDLVGKTFRERTETELDPKWEKGGRFAVLYRRYLSSMKSAAIHQLPAKSGGKGAGKGAFRAQAPACRECHAPQYDFWAGTKHASAYLVLFAKDQHFNPECIACHSLGFQEAGGFSDIASPITLKGHPLRAKGETPFVEKWMKEIFAGDPATGDLDSRKQPERYAALKKRYHAAVDKLQSEGKLQSLHMGVQCEHCHGNRSGHPSTEFKPVGKVTAGRCTSCHTSPHDEGFRFAQRLPAVACPKLRP